MIPSFSSKKPDKEPSTVSFAAPSTMPQVSPSSSTASVRPIGSRPGERIAPSMIGPDLTIMGNLVSKGEVQVDGEVQGDLHAVNVVVGEHATITGGIIADEVVVRGHVLGSIRGKRVMLQASSHVEGDIYHQQISIEQGAFFEGKSRRAEDPTAGVPRPEIPSPPARPSGDSSGPTPIPLPPRS